MDSNERDAACSKPQVSNASDRGEENRVGTPSDAAANSNSATTATSAKRSVTIIGAVDVAQALADNSLHNNLHWFDNNRVVGSQNEGAENLVTAISPGDDINWLLSGLEVETSADIVEMSGPVIEITQPVKISLGPGVTLWQGRVSDQAVPCQSHYALTLILEGRKLQTKLGLKVLARNGSAGSGV